jgi:hypothetical protein
MYINLTLNTKAGPLRFWLRQVSVYILKNTPKNLINMHMFLHHMTTKIRGNGESKKKIPQQIYELWLPF